MSGRLGDGPDDVDAAFAQIVADLEREGLGRTLPKEPPAPEPEPAPEPVARPTEASWRGYQGEHDTFNDNEDEHYEPPEPPPLPKLRLPTMLAIGLLGLGVLLILLPAIAGLDPRYMTPIGLVCMAAGIALLLFRTRTSPRHDPGDNGAEV